MWTSPDANRSWPMNAHDGGLGMLRPGVGSSRREFIRAFTPTSITLPSFPTTIDPKPCALEVSPWPPLFPTHTNAAYGGTPCHNTTTTTPKLVVHPDPLHSPIAAAFATNSSQSTWSGIVQQEGTATTAGDATTLAKTATTPTPFVSLNLSA